MSVDRGTRRFRAVGFDLDGTLFDHAGASRDAASRFLTGLGVEVDGAVIGVWADAERRHFARWRSGEISFHEQRRVRLREVLPPLGVHVPVTDTAVDAMFDDYLSAYEASWRALDRSAELLASLRSRGYRIGVLTNGAEQQQRDKLRRTGLLDAVDVVCTAERLGVAKPDPRAFRAFAAELDTDPGECLFVGDDPDADVDGARAAGFHAALVDRTDPSADLSAVVTAALAGLDPR